MSSHIHRPQPGVAEHVDLRDEEVSLVSPDTIVFITVLFITGALLFLLVYFIITLSDLECDYLNAQQCCTRLNMWVVPKLVVHSLVGVILLVSSHYWLAALSIPMALFWAKEYWTVPSGNFGVYDPTEIHRNMNLKSHMRDVFVGVIFYLVAFFLYLYCFLTHLVTNNPVPKQAWEEDSTL